MRRHLAATAAMVVAMSWLLAGCSDGRSTQAYCDALHQGVDRIKAQEQAPEKTSDSNPVVGLVTAIGGFGELERLLAKLDEVAPSDIEPDVAKVHDIMAEQLKLTNGGDWKSLLGNFAGSALQSLAYQESFGRVDNYSKTNCGVGLF